MATVLLAALLLLLPMPLALSSGGSGSWGVAPLGPLEPSSAADAPHVMWPTPNPTPEDRLYFAGSKVGGTVLLDAGPRVEAHLGFWVDCNRDGRIQTLAYPSETLLDASLCPPMGVIVGDELPPHNAQGRVVEFFPHHGAAPWAQAPVTVVAYHTAGPLAGTFETLAFDPSSGAYVGSDLWGVADAPVFLAATPGVPPEALPGGGITLLSPHGLSYHLRDVDP